MVECLNGNRGIEGLGLTGEMVRDSTTFLGSGFGQSMHFSELKCMFLTLNILLGYKQIFHYVMI